MNRILIVEDDKMLSNGIALTLRNDDYEFVQVYNIESAGKAMKEQAFDLILLDINLPDGNGLAFLESIRETSRIPIILLTANDMEIDIVTGLEMGADDYITKPFSLMVLRARVNTQLRKTQIAEEEEIRIDDYRFHFGKMEFFKGNLLLDLSKTEQKLLKVLVTNRGNVISRGDLVDRIWTDGADYVDENALSVAIKRLRNKLDDANASESYIKTVYGIGYSWVVK